MTAGLLKLGAAMPGAPDIPPGFSGSFEVLETLTKTCAIIDGDAPVA